MSAEDVAELRAIVGPTLSDEECRNLLQAYGNVPAAADGWLAATSSLSSSSSSSSSSLSSSSPSNNEGSQRNLVTNQSIISRLFRSMFSSRASPLIQGPEAASRLKAAFEDRFGTPPQFIQNSYMQAASLARQQSKFLLVYLHSPFHQDTDKFCRRTLASNEVTEFINEQFLIWGGSIEYAEPYQLMETQLRPEGFPFLATLMFRPNDPRGYFVDRHSGVLGPTELIQRLSVVMAANQEFLDRIRTESEQRVQSSVLVNEQNYAYEQAAAADRERETAAREERLRREQEEDDSRAKAELEAALELSKTLDKEANLKRKRESLQAEPPKGPEATKLRLQLPNGSKIDRRFLATSTLQDVRDFVDVYLGDNEIPIESYSLSTTYPRKTYENKAETLQDAGLHPQSVLYVQDLEA